MLHQMIKVLMMRNAIAADSAFSAPTCGLSSQAVNVSLIPNPDGAKIAR